MKVLSGKRIGILQQVVIIAVISALFTYLAGRLYIESIWNVLWVFVPPAFIAILCNNQKGRQLYMAALLMATSMATLVAVSVFVWGGH